MWLPLETEAAIFYWHSFIQSILGVILYWCPFIESSIGFKSIFSLDNTTSLLLIIVKILNFYIKV